MLVGLLGGGSADDLNSLSVWLMAVDVRAVGFGFAEIGAAGVGGVEAKCLRIWAANSARVAGNGVDAFAKVIGG